ncbi:MAG: dehydrogenase E1 component subunit alpha/beta [Deltaproteobacteria bacterium]|uniref:Dehydrogenase E1 component subunit alpha/beta n=1 Tax=Candidatus Zymogenus saltonus TaxID=2844893 RepID=A0A9D8KEV0_9DELT|nr:dehydrogenase E1 component subunit alpha/beta [Candidatus Zymogenus saltonus]
MWPFKDRDEMVGVLSSLWDKILNDKVIVDSVSSVKILVKFRLKDPDANLYIDTRGDLPRYFWDPENPDDPDMDPDVEMILSAETSHKFWMQDINVPLAIAGRKIIAKGSVQKALKLLPALKPAFALYPGVLKECGRDDLLTAPEKGKKRKRKGRLWKRGKGVKRGTYDTKLLPEFPLELVERGGEIPRAKVNAKLRKATETDILKNMCLIRAFEEHLSAAFRDGVLPTEAIHLSIGQEAVATGVCLSLRDSDYVNTTHRGHGHIIAKGADVKKMMAEIYGKAPGLCGGKGGSMHVTDGTRGVLGANGIVGAGYLLAMGAGLTIKMQNIGKKEKRDDISVVFAGDGSVNQGMFHEAANMASVFGLPVLFVIENNLYGEFTSVENHSAVPELYRRAAAYGMEAVRIDGNDVVKVMKGVSDMIEKIRKDSKPRLVELLTYRWHGHMEGDPQLYREEKEREAYKKKCPILRFEKDLVKRGAMTKEDVESIKREAEAVVSEAAEFSESAKVPEPKSLMTQVYTPEEKSLFTGSFGKLTTGGFDKLTTGREVSMSQAINEALAEEMERDKNVFVWGEDVTLGGYFNVTDGLVERFGKDRIIDTPISENGIIGGAVGAAITGLRPVPEILFSDFLTCAMDPILNQAAKIRYMTGGQVSVPMTIRTPVGSGIGMAAQHSQSMERFFFGIPGLIVVAPSDAFTAKGILKAAIRSNNPVIFFEHKLLYAEAGKVPEGDYTLPIGKARVVREGDDLTIVTHLLGVGVSLKAAEILSDNGIEAEVIDLVTLYPMDMETVLKSVKKTGRLVAVEEGNPTGGIGSEVIAKTVICGHGLLSQNPIRIAAGETPIPYASNLENLMIPNPEKIAERIEAELGR